MVNDDSLEEDVDTLNDRFAKECHIRVVEQEKSQTQAAGEGLTRMNPGTVEECEETQMEDSLGEREKEALEQLLQELEEFFIRPQENVSAAIANEKESLNTESKQKPPEPEKTKPEWSLQEKEEVERMLKVGFIRSNECPTWLSNMIKATKSQQHSQMLHGLPKIPHQDKG